MLTTKWVLWSLWEMSFVEVLIAHAEGMNSLWNWKTKATQEPSCSQSRKNRRKWENLRMESEKKKQNNLASSKSCNGIDFIKADFRRSFQGCNFTRICSYSIRHLSKVVLCPWLLSMLRAHKGCYCQTYLVTLPVHHQGLWSAYTAMRKGRITSPGSALIHMWLHDKNKPKMILKMVGPVSVVCYNVMSPKGESFRLMNLTSLLEEIRPGLLTRMIDIVVLGKWLTFLSSLFFIYKKGIW